MNKTILLLATALIAGCATPVTQSVAPQNYYDKNTKVGFEDRPDGFVTSIYYSRYQFIPESDAVAVACRQALTSIAWEHASKTGRKIELINDQEVRLSMGRNGLTGITSCT
ncbi:MAG: hypothetical protein JSS84_10155, partial [Bacteroidetes bacterium]|nr:hypothetical protein [Bacteroidota bacterium]